MKYLRPFPVTVFAFVFSCLGAFASHGRADGPVNFSPELVGESHASLLLIHSGSDFDGDHLPDLVTARMGKHSYEIEVQLTSRRETVTLRSSGYSDALTVFAVDIDHDRDQDLVVGSASNFHAQSVWLNDGSGHFSESPARLYATQEFSAQGEPQRYDGQRPDTDRAATLQHNKWPLDQPQASCSQAQAAKRQWICELPNLPPQALASNRASRAPPLPSHS
jgi:hypothetical protein